MLENKDKLTICFFGEAKPEDIHTVKWAKYFSDRGHNVHLFSYSDFGNNKTKGIKLHLIKKKFPINTWPLNTLINLPFILIAVRKIIKKINPDSVHAHCITSYGTLASFTGFHPYVLTAWGSDVLINPNLNPIIKWTTKYVLKRADLITCDAEHMKIAMEKLGADFSKIRIIHFGIDTKKFISGREDKALKRKLEILRDKVVISLRNLEPIYDIKTLIKAASIILQEISNIKFIIAGKGSQEEKLKRLAKDLRVQENIIFVGHIPNEELPKYLRLADIYVSTSLSDGGIASSTAEAMACGLPVVVTDSGENKKWIENGRHGFIVPIKNPEDLAGKIIFLLKNKKERLKMGQRARKIIEERNDYYEEMSKMERIYSILSSKNN